MNKVTNLSDAQAVDTELAFDKLEVVQSQVYLAGAGIQGFQPDVVVANAETKTVMDILVAAGVCSAATYYGMFADNIMESMMALADQGVIDTRYLEVDVVPDGDDAA